MDEVEFAVDVLGLQPDARQADWLRRRVRRGLLNCTRQWGKSTLTAAKAVYTAWTQPESMVVVVGPSGRQSGEYLEKARGVVEKMGIQPRGDGIHKISLLLPNRSRIVGLPESHQRVRGLSALRLLIVDEASWVSERMFRAVWPMLAVSGGDMWLLSTPNGKQGVFWELWDRGGKEWDRMEVPATECERIPAWFLEEERRRHGERSFRQEYMCEFNDAEGSVFRQEWIQNMVRKDLPAWNELGRRRQT